MMRERCIFDNCGVILTLIIHWLSPSLFLPRCSEATQSGVRGLLKERKREEMLVNFEFYDS